MAAVFALESLYSAVKVAIEASWSNRVIVEWGQTRPPMQVTAGTVGRVVIVPGSVDGDMGTITGAKQWPQPAKALYCLNEPFQVYCWGHNPAVVRSADLSHDHVAFQVLHEVLRQLFLVSHHWGPVTSPVVIGQPKMLRPLGSCTAGREYLVPCVIEQPILDLFDDDLMYSNVAPGRAAITDTLGNVSEQSTTEIP
jgi:hypothetical protein